MPDCCRIGWRDWTYTCCRDIGGWKKWSGFKNRQVLSQPILRYASTDGVVPPVGVATKPYDSGNCSAVRNQVKTSWADSKTRDKRVRDGALRRGQRSLPPSLPERSEAVRRCLGPLSFCSVPMRLAWGLSGDQATHSTFPRGPSAYSTGRFCFLAT